MSWSFCFLTQVRCLNNSHHCVICWQTLRAQKKLVGSFFSEICVALLMSVWKIYCASEHIYIVFDLKLFTNARKLESILDLNSVHNSKLLARMAVAILLWVFSSWLAAEIILLMIVLSSSSPFVLLFYFVQFFSFYPSSLL